MNVEKLIASIGAGLGLVSTAIGIWVAYSNHELQLASALQTDAINDQKAQLEAADQLLRQRADTRAEATTEREYIIRVYDKVAEALQATEPRRQIVALALIETLPDPDLRERLSRAFARLPDLDPAVSQRVQSIRADAKTASAERNVQGWAYDVFWCAPNQQNQVLAASALAAVGQGANATRVRLRRWTPQANAEPGFQVSGLEIRAEDSEQEQAAVLSQLLKKTTGETFTIHTVHNPTPNYLSVWVCR
jgi:hypothetical protein